MTDAIAYELLLLLIIIVFDYEKNIIITKMTNSLFINFHLCKHCF
jgi:hypothetical protein